MKDVRQIFSHHNIYLFGLVLMAVGLPLSLFLMSLSQFILAGNYLLEGKYREKWKQLVSNKALLVFLSIYILHALGILYSDDIGYALKDLRIKAPVFILPLIMATSQKIEARHFRMILLFFAGAVLAGTIISMGALYTLDINNFRDISVFISHIRFSLNIVLAIMVLLSFVHLSPYSKAFRALMLAAALWLIIFIFILQSLTGIVLIVILLLIYIVNYSLIRGSKSLLISSGIMVLTILIGIGIYSGTIVKEFREQPDIDFSKLDTFTPYGNLYAHDTNNCLKVNGNYVWVYINEDELGKVWAQRSDIPFDSLDSKGNRIKDIIFRFMTSKGLRKDGAALASLSDDEIGMIEAGIPNAEYYQSNVIRRRINQILWEYQNYICTGNPSGHSVLMRYEYWRAALGIIGENLIIGVGTGDLNLAFENQYEKMDSKLVKEWRLRAHNQFLSIWIAFGVLGFIWFILALFLPPFLLKITRDYYFNIFFIIFLLSTLTEDTIESQAGASFFAFFYALFLFGRKEFNNAFH